MLTWCALASLLAAVTTVVHWARRRGDVLGRPRRFPAISVSVLVLAGAAALVPVVRHALLERSLTQAASALVGVPVAVHCQTFGEALVATDDHLGFVAEGADGRLERRTTLMRGPCDALAAYRRSDHRDPSEEEVQAVHVLSHEARHMAGVLEEARAECQAVQRDAEAARLLGATDAQARRLARYYWLVLYPRMPAEYTSPNCAPDAAWDEHLPDAPWTPPSP